MGVEWTIRCEALEVYFERKGIEAMKGNATTLPASPFSASLSTAKQVRGRPRGSGSYAASDALFVAKMREYITKHPGASATTAAEQFVNEIAGGATPATKVRRVVGKYRKTHPN
jgi:hypothetical protein